MKTLKYLMLLLAVAVALPAMAQREEEREEAEATEIAMEELAPDAAEATGRLSKHNAYAVAVIGGNLHARVISDKGTILEMVKGANGRAQKTCKAKSKAPCPPGFEFVKEEPVEIVDVFVREKQKEDFREMERAEFQLKDYRVMEMR